MAFPFLDGARLNPMQRKAAETTEGPLLVLAGAGSGKTRVLTHRVAHLILDKGVNPWNILAITFTNKAAAEMKERILSMCGDAFTSTPWISTFHSACVRILRQEIESMGYSRDFTIYDDDDQSKVIDRILKARDIDPKQISTREIKSKISDAKNRMLSPAEYRGEVKGDFRSEKIADVFTEYEKHLKANNALDFDNLILKTIELFRQQPDTLEKYSRRFHYILVDEYQDTNHAQYILIELLAGYWGNLCVVGDDDQSIYGWRGADISNILDFERTFPQAQVVKLEQNYRSTNNILRAANAVIENNTGRKRKELWSDKGEGGKLQIERLSDEKAEAMFVQEEISRLTRSGFHYGDIAVLYRLNSQSRLFEEMLLGSGIPYRIYGGQPFYGRKEVRDAIAYMRLMVNPNDEVALRRIINVPKRGIGAATVDEVASLAQEHADTMYGVILDYGKYDFSGRSANKIKDFSLLMEELLTQSMLLPMDEFVKLLLERTGLADEYRKERTDEARERLENQEELINAVARYQKDFPEATLSDFLINIALVSEPEERLLAGGDTYGTVNLMTIHSAKGLEFRAVFLVGMEEGIFPLSRAAMDETQLEEERRLCYVAMTRAMEKLYLLSTNYRMLYGETRPGVRSRFLAEIPAQLCECKLPPAQERPFASRQNRDYGEFSGGNFRNGNTAPSGRASSGSRYYTGSPAPQSAAPAKKVPSQRFAMAMKVRHRRYGEGTIVDISVSGEDTILRVDFSERGIKDLIASVAPLEII